MIHCGAKVTGFKPTSAIPLKESSLHRPRTKTSKKSEPSYDQPKHGDDATPLPPPALIRLMQDLGASLGVAPEALTMDKLIAGLESEPAKSSSNDD